MAANGGDEVVETEAAKATTKGDNLKIWEFSSGFSGAISEIKSFGFQSFMFLRELSLENKPLLWWFPAE